MVTPWLDGVVQDYVYFKFSIAPLPYHNFAFQVAQIMPYLMDVCYSGGACQMDEYRNYCYSGDVQESVLNNTSMSLD
jgi:hypothetical protein